jgi:lysophospholipase L1-like esterase
MPEYAERVVFIGDSIIEGWDVADKFLPFRVCNMGVAGSTIEELTKRIVSDNDFSKYDIAVVMIGTNDAWFFDGVSDSLFIEGYNVIVKKYNNLFSILDSLEIKYYVLSLLPVNKYFSKNYSVKNRLHKSINEEVQLLLKKSCNGTYVDVFEDFGGLSGMNSTMSTDGLHLSFSGYDQLTKITRRVLFNDN